MIFFKGKKVYHKSAITQLWHVQTKFETLSDDVNLKLSNFVTAKSTQKQNKKPTQNTFFLSLLAKIVLLKKQPV